MRPARCLRAAARAIAPFALARRGLCNAAAAPALVEGLARPGRFNAVEVDFTAAAAPLPITTVTDLTAALRAAVARWRAEGKTCVWLTCAMRDGTVLAAADDAGFLFHHAEAKRASLYLWLAPEPSMVPAFATHQVGVAGVVLDAQRRLLVVKDRHKSDQWKFAGGLANLGEDFADTAAREVLEETGVRAAFRGLLALRHQHGVAYGRSDLYVLCRMHALSTDITVDASEILDARWMDGDAYVAQCAHPVNRFVAAAALRDFDEERRGGDPTVSGAGIVEESVFIPITGRRVRCYRSAHGGRFSDAAAAAAAVRAAGDQ
jgi:ADP-ribose pyrophosphatase YjhB (NUDIX family)